MQLSLLSAGSKFYAYIRRNFFSVLIASSQEAVCVAV